MIKLKNLLTENQSTASESTKIYETAALMGLFMKPEPFHDFFEMYSNSKIFTKKYGVNTSVINVYAKKNMLSLLSFIKNIKDLSNIILSIPMSNQNVDMSIVSKIKATLRNIHTIDFLKVKGKIKIAAITKQLDEIIKIFALCYGASLFRKSIIPFEKINCIHKNIEMYYSIEKSLGNIREKSKKNTTDAIICNVSSKEFLKLFADVAKTKGESRIINNSAGYSVIDNKVKFFQISLKLGHDLAQLGKITKKLDNFLEPFPDVFSDLGIINKKIKSEGVLQESWLNDAGDWVSEKISLAWNKLKEFTKDFVTNIMFLFVNGKTIESSEIEKCLNGYNLIEGLLPKNTNQLLEADLEKRARKIILIVKQHPKILYNNVNDRIKELKKLVKNYPLVKSLIKPLNVKNNFYLNKKLAKERNFPAETTNIMTLISNFATMGTIINLLNQSNNNLQEIKGVIGDLSAEIFFGWTKFPLWKLYGTIDTNSPPYEYLGTADDYIKKYQKSLSNTKNIDIIGIRVAPESMSSGGHWLTIYLYILIRLEKDKNELKKLFAQIRTGTNSGSHFTQIYEGTKTLGPFNMEYDIIQLLEQE